MMEQRLQSGLAALNLPVEGIPALVRYGDLLIETNKVMNLTAITDPEDVATLHFLDSAALLTLESFSGKSVVDVGTGARFSRSAPAGAGALHPPDAAGLPEQAHPVPGDGVPGAGPPRCGLRSTPGRRNLPRSTGNL